MVTLQKRNSDFENSFLQLTIENKGNGDPDSRSSSAHDDLVDEFRKVLEGRDGQVVALGNEELKRFLRAGSFVIEKARVIFEKNEKYNRENADLIAITFDMVQYIYDTEVIQVLRGRCPLNSKIILVNAKNWNPDKVSLEYAMMAGWYLLNEMLYSEETQINGISLILDLSGVSMWQAARFVSHFTMKQVQRLLTFYEGGYPIKLKSIHTVNTPIVVSSTYAGFKYLLKKKIRDRIHVHYCGPKVLSTYFSNDILPKSLEGSLPYSEAIDQQLMENMYKRYEK